MEKAGFELILSHILKNGRTLKILGCPQRKILKLFRHFLTFCMKGLTLKDLFISESCIEIKIELNFYFHTSLWCLKRFYEGL